MHVLARMHLFAEGIMRKSWSQSTQSPERTFMEFLEFEEQLIECLKEKLSDEFELTIKDTLKNNGVKLRGVVLKRKGKNLAPTVYINSFYEEYIEGEEIANIADEIINVSLKYALNDSINEELFEDYEFLKDYIFVKLISIEKNVELLDEVPFVRFLDLAIVAYCEVSSFLNAKGTFLIKHEFLKKWNKSPQNVLEYAIENTKKNLGCELIDLAEMLMHSKLIEEDECIPEEHIMHVLTNNTKQFGAVCMIYEDVISKYCDEIDSNVYVIPSSIHEVILIPSGVNPCYGNINEMIQSVNETLPRGEILSDHAYYFSRSDGYEII